MVRIEVRLGEEDWARFRSGYPSEGQALRALRLLFEDGFRVALVGSGEAWRAAWERFE